MDSVAQRTAVLDREQCRLAASVGDSDRQRSPTGRRSWRVADRFDVIQAGVRMGTAAVSQELEASSYRMGALVARRTAVLDRERFRLGTAVAHRTAVLESRGRIRGHPDWVRTDGRGSPGASGSDDKISCGKFVPNGDIGCPEDSGP